LRLARLALRNYRNYHRLGLELSPSLNVFLGPNAQGKTNLLESVALLALSSSPRARRDSELIGPAAPEASIEATVERERGRAVEVMVRVSEAGDRTVKTIRVDGVPRRAIDLPGEVQVTLFWPEDLGLVKGGPDQRRRFLNELLVQVVPGYARRLAAYRRTLEQRNGLLKRVAAGLEPASALEVWDPSLAALGGEITAARAEAVAELAGAAADHHLVISGGERLEIRYEGVPGPLADLLAAARAEDVRRGSTSVGPHRDDLAIAIEGADARSYGSQGQQRTAVVSLKLAEADLMAARSGERPLVLLDDVLSELDAERRAALLKGVATQGQVIVTAVDAETFPEAMRADAVVRCIAQGRVEACG
jgi:DNA replication and repair protein RecF